MEGDKLTSFSILKKTLAEYKWQVFILSVLGFFSAILEGVGIGAFIPLVALLLDTGTETNNAISEIIQFFFETFSISFSFRYLFILIAILFIARAVVLMASTYIRGRITADFIRCEMTRIFSELFFAKWSFLLRQKIGYIQNTVVWDVRRSANLLEVVTQIIQSSTGLIIYLGVAITISPSITFITLMTGVLLLVVLKPLLQKTRTVNTETSVADKTLTQHISENVSGIKVVKAAGKEEYVYNKSSEYISKLRNLYVKNVLVSSLGTILIQPFSLIYVMLIFVFVYFTGRFEIAAFAATLYLIQKIFIYLQSGQGAMHSVNELLPYAENVIKFGDLLKKNIESQEGERVIKFNKELVFENVSFFYDEKSPVITDISFALRKGETVGLIGPSGTGKTSIADLILRLFEPTRGKIVVDDIDLNKISLKDWRSKIGYVSQETFLFNDSIRNNITFYNSSFKEEEIIEASKKAHIYDFISSLPQGFDTLVGDRGVMLSSGQRQRISLARTLISCPVILILDEATSALDGESEALIQKAIAELHGKVTVFMIAHRLGTVMKADRVIVLKDGKIVEEGKPTLLLEDQSSYFNRIHNLNRSG